MEGTDTRNATENPTFRRGKMNHKFYSSLLLALLSTSLLLGSCSDSTRRITGAETNESEFALTKPGNNGNVEVSTSAELHAAITDPSNEGNIIKLAAGTYIPTERVDPLDPRTATFLVTVSGLTIDGAGVATPLRSA